MIAVITSIELKGPLKFFALSLYALNIMKQLKGGNHVDFKKRGIWTKHYTMSLWKNAEDMKTFARSGAHLEAMKKSAAIAKEIRTVSMEANQLPDWKTALKLLENGKGFKF